MELISGIALALFFTIIVGIIAERKGRSVLGFVLLSVFTCPLIGLIAVLVASPNQAVLDRRAVDSGHFRRCPHCAELVRAAARVCRSCCREVATPTCTPVIPNAHVPNPGGSSAIADLERLGYLLEKGVITHDDFQAKKKKLLEP